MGKDSLLSSAGMLLGFRLDSRAVIAKAAAGLPLCKGKKKATSVERGGLGNGVLGKSILLQHEIFEVNFHWWSCVDLQSEYAFFGTFCCSICYIDGLFAIDEMLQMTAFGDDAVDIPIVRLDSGLDLVAFADFSSYVNLWFVGSLTLIDRHFLAALCKDATTFFFVKNAAVSFPKLKIGLVARDNEVGFVHERTAVLYSAVTGV